MLALRVTWFCVGMLLVGYAMFTYEDEEKRFKNWFEIAWMAAADREKTASARVNAFLHQLLNGLNGLLARIYGESPYSIRALLVCLCVSAGLSSLLILPSGRLHQEVQLFAGAVTLLVPFIRAKKLFFIGAGVALVAFFFINEAAMISRRASPYITAQLNFIAVPIAGIFDSLATGAVRKAFIAGARASRLLSTIAFSVLGTLLSPIIIFFAAAFTSAVDEYVLGEGLDIEILRVLTFNSIALVTSFSLLLLISFSILWRIVWAALPRALYAVIKLKLLDNRKATTTVGIAIMGSVMPGVGSALGKITAMLGL